MIGPDSTSERVQLKTFKNINKTAVFTVLMLSVTRSYFLSHSLFWHYFISPSITNSWMEKKPGLNCICINISLSLHQPEGHSRTIFTTETVQMENLQKNKFERQISTFLCDCLH
ncbi:hypothetical protein fugu_010968 [Takifugu bimaculatus]|uniref:Uncharacterized protein n=1 Tax=Takifugu bimaculatus TaxID=433685 RepID=A0A4Z2CBN6_9TELE|nr:hypothetical protein fugu_010968 [Takifugu bimaculatus]